jgi:hypothetical protein
VPILKQKCDVCGAERSHLNGTRVDIPAPRLDHRNRANGKVLNFCMQKDPTNETAEEGFLICRHLGCELDSRGLSDQ